MFWFVLAVLIGLIGLGMFIVGKIEDGSVTYRIRGWSVIPLGIATLFLILSSIRVVSPGSVGVPVTFGKAGGARDSGIAFVAPWTGMRNISTRLTNYTMSSAQGEGAKGGDDSVPVNTKDQVEVTVDSTALFRVTRTQARGIYVNLGTDYVDQVVRPTIRSAIRDAATSYNAIDLATDDRALFQGAAQTQIEQQLSKFGIVLQDLQIRDIHLPSSLQTAITAKAAAQQDVVRQGFILQSKEQQQKQRVVDAQGLAKSQTIIHSTLNPLYLQYLYITEMGNLAQSKNTTFLFLPSNPGDLPNFQVPLNVK